MMTRAYKVVDVFTNQPMLGNPVAVVLDAQGLDDQAMQRIARWTNLSETTFLLPPTVNDADYRLRIFTPQSELPFAGHPTLGSAYAALEAGRVTPRNGKLVQECGVGMIELELKNEGPQQQLSFRMPPAKVTPLSDADVTELEAILGHTIVREAPPAIVNVGAVWVVAQLPNVAALLRLQPDYARSARFETSLGATGLSVFAIRENGSIAIEVRSFAPSCGVNEDPVCGSGNGSVGVFLRERAMLSAVGSTYTAGQGRCVGREGYVSVVVDGDDIELGGACVTCIDGTLNC